WALSGSSRLSKQTRRLIEKSDVHVSAASIWEISIKAAAGQLSASPSDVLAAVEPTGFSLLAITGEHAAFVATLPMHPRDPFDRWRIAQAMAEPMHLLTNDEALRAYGDFVMIS